MRKQRSFLKGKTFDRLTVIGDRTELINGVYYWLCKCSCGVEKYIHAGRLRTFGPRTKSCGCMDSENWDRMKGNITSPRKVQRKEFVSWQSMKTRCYYKKGEHYPRYGGRGITVCDRWRWSFQNFFEDLGPAPSPKHTVERNDINGNYEPSNCRWATNAEQQSNKSTTMFVTYKGNTVTLSNLCREHNIPYLRAWRRITKKGFSVEDAIHIPNMKQKGYFRTSPDPTVQEINTLFQ